MTERTRDARRHAEVTRREPVLPLARLWTVPGHLIRRAQQKAVAKFMEACAAHDLTPVQCAALAAVDDSPGLTASELAERIAFDRSTVGDVVDRLVRKRLLRRRADPRDRRVRRLYLTDEGRAVLERALPDVLDAQRAILEPLTAEEAELLVRLLRRLTGVEPVEQAAAPREGGTDRGAAATIEAVQSGEEVS